MIRVSKIWAPNAGEFQIAEPRFAIGDRCRTRKPTIADGELIVERIDGPYLSHNGDQDAFLYRVYDASRGLRFPCSGLSLIRA